MSGPAMGGGDMSGEPMPTLGELFNPYHMQWPLYPDKHDVENQVAELTELKRRHQTLLDALDNDRSTAISKRVVRAILKGR